MQKTDHRKQVDAWFKHAAKDAPAAAMLALFESAWGALWRRAESAIGEIVLESIGGVIHSSSAAKYPILAPLKLGKAEVSCKPLLEIGDALDPRELQEGLCFMLVEFMTVLGDLTDQILTPGLYAELSGIAPGAKAQPSKKQEKPEAAIAMTLKEQPILVKDNLISTGVKNLDAMLAGGLIKGSSTAIAGPPGSGKTILAQEIAFRNATPESPVLYFSTLSEPGSKSLFYLTQFDYCDRKKIDESIHFVDLGILLRTKGLQKTLELIVERVKKSKPALVVVDSFKVFEDMAESREELRKFSYEIVVNLIARKCTVLFLGEYAPREIAGNPLFSIIDGLILMTQRELSGEPQRFIQIVKMRGLAHTRDEQIFEITREGIQVFTPRLSIKRGEKKRANDEKVLRCKTGIGKLDDLLGDGIPRGSSLLIAGVAGTGKTVLGLEFVYRGALAGEKGIIFSFEETEARLRDEARGLGWEFDALIKSGMIEIVYVPQPDIMVERDLFMMEEKIAASKAARVIVDSFSVFVRKLKDEHLVRDKVFQLVSIVQNAGAVAFLTTDIPYGSPIMSRFGVEETVADGVILLTSTEEGLERQRYLEVYKVRNTDHLKGRHTMTIETGGIKIFPRYRDQDLSKIKMPPARIARRLSCGVGGLDKLLGDGVMDGSMTLVSGSSGIGKTTLSLEFILAGALKGEPGIYVTMEEAPAELLANATSLGLPLKKAVDDGLVDIFYLPPTHIRSTQLLTLLTDKIKKNKTRRLVLDSTTHIVASGMSQDDVRELLYDMVVRFRALGVTSIFTLESDLMYSTDSSTDTYRGFAPMADNVIVLRYVPGVKVTSSLMVVKTRGSANISTPHTFHIEHGGVHIGAPIQAIGPTKDTSGPTGDQQAQAAGNSRKHQ